MPARTISIETLQRHEKEWQSFRQTVHVSRPSKTTDDTDSGEHDDSATKRH